MILDDLGEFWGWGRTRDGFRTLLPAASFLTPMESRNEENISRVRMFGQEKLSKDLSSQKWDQFKVLIYSRVIWGVSPLRFTSHFILS